ncbi:MAG: hypothetical protein IJU33_00140 [Bacteroidales bacterium]|nr:hypothetical protein [Bacteroidales bacterium]
MSKYNVNLRRLVNSLMPSALRGNIVVLARVLISGVENLQDRMVVVRNTQHEDLDYNCQYASMQRMLNDKLDKYFRRIQVCEATGEMTTPIVYPSSNIYVQMEIALVVVYPWQVYVYSPFEICVPATVYDTEYNKVVKLADIYKLAGTKYKIKKQINE